MALRLTQDYKGIPAEYWKILKAAYDTEKNETTVRLACYKDEPARRTSPNNHLKIISFIFKKTIDATRSELYTKIKEPRYEIALNEQTGEEEEVGDNLNPFVEAEDC